MGNRLKQIVLFCLGMFIIFGCTDDVVEHGDHLSLETGKDWPVYGGDRLGNRYSPLSQVNKDNVQDLEIAWVFDARDMSEDGTSKKSGAIQCQPIVVDGILYGTTPELSLFSVNAATGKELWRFLPARDSTKFLISASRGIAYWEKGDDQRILYASGSFLYAVNAKTGKIVPSFGKDGRVDLHAGLSDGIDTDISETAVNATSPGIVFKDVFIIGSSVSEKGDAPPGNIRAFDVVTGALKWVFHTIPHPGEEGYDTWPENAYREIGGANNWSGMSLDSKRGAVYFGTGSPTSDFYGGNRKGKNLFGNCVVSLDALTGELKWYFQTIHHDLWDRDLPSPPNLTTITHNGKKVDVAVQATKDGLVYVLDRDTGESIFPIEERSVPIENILPGEHPWPTQKYPSKPAPLSHQIFTEDDITDLSPESHAYIKMMFDKYPSPHKFTPPNEKGTLLFGYSGGAEWGGNATDMEGILYQNSNDDPWIVEMIDSKAENKEMEAANTAEGLYALNCATCHGKDRKGTAEFPSLMGINDRLSFQQVTSLLKTGLGRMPSFRHISEESRRAIAAYILELPQGMHPEASEGKPEDEVKTDRFGYEPRYVKKNWRRLTDQDGYPSIKPPWGTLNAIDLNTGDYLWRVPLGEYPELTEKGIPITGRVNYGGPIVTASGLVFIAGTGDEQIRAFDKETGKEVWKHPLPTGGFATPITYEVKGKQYIVLAVGGGRGTELGGEYVAFALKE